MLTYKSVFLFVLATTKRVSGLHAFSGNPRDIAFSADSVTLKFVPVIRAKAQPSIQPHDPIVVPRLSNILCADDEDISLCPVRALRHYLIRTNHCRTGKRRLFVSLYLNMKGHSKKQYLSLVD